MVAKKIAPLLLAASVLACGFTAGFIDKSQSALAITRVDELSDVQRSNWAYDSLKDLVEKYNVIEGYPDKTFRGNRTATRYELAAALNATVKTMGKEIARLGAEKADKKDLAIVAKLQQEFATELMALQARTEALEARATKIEAKNDEQDNRLAILDKMKIYGDMSFGGYSDIAGNPDTLYRDGLSMVGRTRVNADYTIIEDKGGSVVGPGTIHSRLVAAFGRVSPLNDNSTDNSVNAFSGISSIAADASIYNEGVSPNTLVQGIQLGSNTRANAYIDSAYYSQNLRASMPYLPKDDSWRTAFNIHMGLMPWRDLYFKTPYQGNDNNQFQNTALMNNPAIFQDSILPRIAAEMTQGLGRYAKFALKADVSAVDVSNAVDGGIGFTTEADLGYNLGFLDNMIGTKDLFNVGGNVFGGYYFVHSPGTLERLTANPAVTDSLAQGFYVGANQELYKGLGVFGSFAMNDTSSLSALMSALKTNTGSNIIFNNSDLTSYYGVQNAWVFGTELPIRALPNFITFGKRQRDAFGLAYAQIMPIAKFATTGLATAARSSERILESYYKAQITDGFALIPSVQLIFDRAGNKANDVDVAIGFRSSFTF